MTAQVWRPCAAAASGRRRQARAGPSSRKSCTSCPRPCRSAVQCANYLSRADYYFYRMVSRVGTLDRSALARTTLAVRTKYYFYRMVCCGLSRHRSMHTPLWISPYARAAGSRDTRQFSVYPPIQYNTPIGCVQIWHERSIIYKSLDHQRTAGATTPAPAPPPPLLAAAAPALLLADLQVCG
jgi:hypothetical protein